MDQSLATLVLFLWEHPSTTKSDFAREHANEIAVASSRGLITCEILNGEYGRLWKATQEGLAFMTGFFKDLTPEETARIINGERTDIEETGILQSENCPH